MYTCKRCGYNTDRISNIKNHLNRKKPCEPILENVNIEQLKKELISMRLNRIPPKTAKTPPKTAKIFECDECEKQFTRKDSLEKHLKSRCKVKKQKEENIRIKMLEKEMKNKDKEIKRTQKEIAKKDATIEKLAMRPTHQTEYRQTINNKIETMNNLTLEKMQEHSNNLTIDHIRAGPQGYAQFALAGPLKDSITCTDHSRRKLVFKNGSGVVEHDPHMDKTLQMFGESIDNRNTQLIDYERKILAHDTKDIMNDDSIEWDERLFKSQQVYETIKRLENYKESVSELCDSNEVHEDVKKNIKQFKDELVKRICGSTM